ncbi:hypothetical protein [Algoriphagus terrigena]|uniref:hypothetical protein n=1 Tax=Algoriphagus terrigena TaxID=344884 RepID=UPI0003F77D6E|nr:hypothetical protein [Algoriphagus terrigena]
MGWIRIEICLVFLIWGNAQSQAQTWQEWTRQKKLQTEYKLLEIQSLKYFRALVVEGYETAERGLGMVGQIRNGEFGLHSEYLESRKRASSPIKHAAPVERIYRWRNRIEQELKGMDLLWADAGQLRPAEQQAVRELQGLVRKRLGLLVAELESLLNLGGLDLSEGESLRLLDKLENEMATLYTGLHAVNHRLRALGPMRIGSKTDQLIIKELYGDY